MTQSDDEDYPEGVVEVTECDCSFELPELSPIVVGNDPAAPLVGARGRPSQNLYPFFKLNPGDYFEMDITGKDAQYERVKVMNGTRRKGLKGRTFSSSVVAEGNKTMLKVWRVVEQTAPHVS